MIKQTLLKTLSYATMHMTIAIIVAYVLSGSWRVAFAIGLIEPCFQTIAFFFHEHAWHKIEAREHSEDIHNSVIDSTSPASGAVEGMLRKN
ncbi:MAG: DUF2061 domain-containing protein [Alphaproteobacteria bacterium]|nr:DUF2061 domain-containing protein [Alphaproteobacteria bacterium]